ncbi:HET domain protein [Aspergillus mulundensis]|uniref:Heterokaryon incompatibility domain-containing protein n=1 Tax=Aspergillus mulundensis TaxID=1810919 RepID=A0A3D8R962_9EURO|nr:hypothetical protein DSM5745_08037 [Aspergillus mulundensis]RDW70526.1 hypothetical protein DSM5745_08037 [Aspergillus mulundensis]
MSIDIAALQDNTLAKSSRIMLQESILATILFCDWNVRAWTFLESMQGRAKIFFLCKHNNIFSLREILEAVMRDGQLDIGVAFLSAPHLLPASVPKEPFEEVDRVKEDESLSGESSDLDDRDHPDYNKKLVEAAACLRYRPASRNGDAFVIWTILAGTPTLSSAEHFWKAREGSLLSTAFPMSGASRVNARGLSWAPSDPTSSPVPDLFNPHSRAHPEAEMMDAHKGEIKDVGLSASWDVFQFEWPAQGAEAVGEDTASVKKLGEAVSRQLHRTRRKLALLRPLMQDFSRTKGFRIELRSKSVLPFVAVCEFVAEDGGWRWLGVRGLDLNYLMHRFSPEHVLLV